MGSAVMWIFLLKVDEDENSNVKFFASAAMMLSNRCYIYSAHVNLSITRQQNINDIFWTLIGELQYRLSFRVSCFSIIQLAQELSANRTIISTIVNITIAHAPILFSINMFYSQSIISFHKNTLIFLFP